MSRQSYGLDAVSVRTILCASGATNMTAGKAINHAASHADVQALKNVGPRSTTLTVEMPDTSKDMKPDKIRLKSAGAYR